MVTQNAIYYCTPYLVTDVVRRRRRSFGVLVAGRPGAMVLSTAAATSCVIGWPGASR